MTRFFCLLFLFCSYASAEINFKAYHTDESCYIEYSFLFRTADNSLSMSMVPLVVKIENFTSDKSTWNLLAKAGWSSTSNLLKKQLTVEGESARTFTIEVPYNPTRHNMPQIKISGLGINRSYFQSGNNISNHSGQVATARAYRALKSDPSGNNYNYSLITDKTIRYFPEKWSGYTSLKKILLTSDDYEDLKEAQKVALKEWALNGGYLQILTKSIQQRDSFKKTFSKDRFLNTDYRKNHYQGKNMVPMGLGVLEVLIPNSRPDLNIFNSLKKIEEGYNHSAKTMLWETIKEPSVSLILVSILLIAFLIFVGPLNLYIFAKKNRLRLLVTTPVISFAASTIFFITIIFHDGFGGEGIKKSFVWLNSKQKRCVIIQNQIVKNAIMLSPSFKRESNYLLAAYENPEDRYRHAHNVRSTQVISNGEWISGDMFNSRSRRLMILKDVRSTQASLEILGEGKVPTIRSNFQNTLKNIIIIDEQGSFWQADQCLPGETVKLKSIKFDDIKTALKVHLKGLNESNLELFIAEASGKNEFDIVTNTKTSWTSQEYIIGGDLKEGKL